MGIEPTIEKTGATEPEKPLTDKLGRKRPTGRPKGATGIPKLARPLKVKAAKCSTEQLVTMQAHYEHGTHTMRALGALYGIGPSTVMYYAKRYGWAPCGSKKEAALAEAKEKVIAEIADSYTAIVKEVNERQLQRFRGQSTVLDALTAGVVKRIRYAEEMTKLAEQEEAAEALKMGRPPRPVKPFTTAHEAIVMERLVSSMKTALIDCERLILGIKDGALDKEDPNSGIKSISDILKNARAEFGDLSETTPDQGEPGEESEEGIDHD